MTRKFRLGKSNPVTPEMPVFDELWRTRLGDPPVVLDRGQRVPGGNIVPNKGAYLIRSRDGFLESPLLPRRLRHHH